MQVIEQFAGQENGRAECLQVRIPGKAGGVSVEGPGAHVVDRRSSAPVSLVVPTPDLTVGGAGDSIVHPKTAGKGSELPVFMVTNHPSTQMVGRKIPPSSALLRVFASG